MTKPVDMELRKAFEDVQTKMVETATKLKQIDEQMLALTRVSKHVNLAQSEINNVGAGTQFYESVGHMFVLSELNEVNENFNKRQEAVQKKTQDLTVSKQYLERTLKESQDNLREMIQHKKEQTA